MRDAARFDINGRPECYEHPGRPNHFERARFAMAKPSIRDRSVLNKLLRYDPETGSLFWRARPISFFEDPRIWRSWNGRYADTPAFTAIGTTGYRYGNIFNHKSRAHQVIWCMVHGEWPDVIDHIDGDKLNNRIENLRSVSQFENMRNTKLPSDNTSGAIGVFFDARTNRWQAQISENGKTKFLGRCADFGEAVALRKHAEARLGYHPNHGRAS